MLIAEIVVFLGLGVLGSQLFRRFLKWQFPSLSDGYIELTYYGFIIIGVILYFPKATQEQNLRDSLSRTQTQLSRAESELQNTAATLNDTRAKVGESAAQLMRTEEALTKSKAEATATKNELSKAQEELEQVNQRESLRQWAMLVPTGEEARDAMGMDIVVKSSKRTEAFRKVFQVTDGAMGFAGQLRCKNDAYITAIRHLIEQYERSPYPYVALAFCLKDRGDPSWRKVGAHVKRMLETFISIEPHVVHIDSMYAMLIMYLFEDKTPLENTGFFIPFGERSYRPKNMPPG